MSVCVRLSVNVIQELSAVCPGASVADMFVVTSDSHSVAESNENMIF